MLTELKFSASGTSLKTKFPTDFMNSGSRLTIDFYTRDVLKVAPELIGKEIVIRDKNNSCKRFTINEVEAYRGEKDKACHASKGRTKRTEIMFSEGGKLYLYFVYGMYWMLNIVTGERENPQAALIRGVEGLKGPGILTRGIGIDGSYYGEDLTRSDKIWIEDKGIIPEIKTGKRIGIDYAGDPWKDKPWRYFG
jgi:DNA-3-methyladenine glycosylase